MRPVRTQSEPQRIIERPGVDIRLDLPAARGAEGAQAMGTVGKPAARTVAESDHRRERRPLAEALRIVIDDLLGDLLAHLGARRSRRCCRSSVTASSATTRPAAPATTSSRRRAAPRFFIDCGPDCAGALTLVMDRVEAGHVLTSPARRHDRDAAGHREDGDHPGTCRHRLRARRGAEEGSLRAARRRAPPAGGRAARSRRRPGSHHARPRAGCLREEAESHVKVEHVLHRDAIPTRWSTPNARSKPRIRRAGFSNTSRSEKLALTNTPSGTERSRLQVRHRVEHLDAPRSSPS